MIAENAEIWTVETSTGNLPAWMPVDSGRPGFERVDDDERIAEQYLKSLCIGEVVYEPDGKILPDFLVNG